MENSPLNQANLSAADLYGAQLGLSLDDPRKKHAYEQMILERWKDWVGDKSKAAGYPEIKTEYGKLAMAMVLENQRRFQRDREVQITSYGTVPLVQDVTTADEALPTRYALPIVRRAYALLINADWMVTQPLPGPTGYVFYLDFIREGDTTNTLSVEYNRFFTAELAVPEKSKLKLIREVITADKQLMGMAFSLEAQEDARAQLGMDIERELLRHFSLEFVRNLFGRQLKAVALASKSGVPTGSNLGTPWSVANTQHTFPDKAANTIAEYKGMVYNKLIDADADFQKANRNPSNGIVCGYGLAAFLQKLNTATQSQAPSESNMSSVGITDYGTYAGRWNIWATDFMPDDEGFIYNRNPEQLNAGFIYAPYVPVQVMPAIYADYNTGTGEYTNKDAYTRNIRERSAYKVTKPYAFQPIKGPAAGLGVW